MPEGAYAKVEAEGKVQVPLPLQDGTPSAGDARDPSAGSGQALGHGEGFVYPHMEPGHYGGQQYLPMTRRVPTSSLEIFLTPRP